MTEPREVPEFATKKWRSWRQLQNAYGWLHLLLGSVSVAMSSLMAANAAMRQGFLLPAQAVAMATVGAITAFALTLVNSKQKKHAFEVAARELEKAMALYQADPSLNLRFLADAEVRGIEMLDRVKPE
jgi:hypothetical protein